MIPEDRNQTATIFKIDHDVEHAFWVDAPVNKVASKVSVSSERMFSNSNNADNATDQPWMSPIAIVREIAPGAPQRSLPSRRRPGRVEIHLAVAVGDNDCHVVMVLVFELPGGFGGFSVAVGLEDEGAG